jgi:capsid portal protein
MPEYLSALQSGLLNESATLFRRKYYINGSHAGYILHVSDENFTERDSEALREAMRRSKGPATATSSSTSRAASPMA